MSQSLEILVHISAPSQGRDDARYRTEARGFLDFEPVERLNILNYDHLRTKNADEEISSEYGSFLAEFNEQEHGTQKAVENEATISERQDLHESLSRSRRLCRHGKAGEESAKGSQKRNTTTPSKHSSGIGNNGRDIAKTGRTSGEGERCMAKDAKVRLARIKEDFMNQPFVKHTPVRQKAIGSGSVQRPSHQSGAIQKTPSVLHLEKSPAAPWTGVLETPHLLIARTPALSRPRTAPTEPSKSQEVPTLRRTQSDSWQTPPSTIPDSQPSYHSPAAFEMTSLPNLKRPFQSSSPSPTRDASLSLKQPQLQVPSSPPLGDPPAEISSSLNLDSQQVAKRPRLQVPSSPLMEDLPSGTSPVAEVPTSSPPEDPPSEASPPSELPPSSQAASLRSSSQPNPDPPATPPKLAPYKSLQINPPRPKVSNAHFKTHLTSHLLTISNALPLTQGFHRYIAHQTHTPAILERGYWLIPQKTWSQALKTELWDFLTIYIGEGYVGWGVWAVTEMLVFDKDGKEVPSEWGNRAVGVREEVAKVFCWGETVGEVWTLLFIGNGNRKPLVGNGTRWIDSTGEAVFTMK